MVAKVVPDSSITLTSKGDGRWEGKYLLVPDTNVLFVVDRSVGLNVTSVEGRLLGGELRAKWAVVWKMIGDQWHIVELTETRFKSRKITTEHKLRWEKLEPGKKPPADVFTIASLKLPPGSRFLDRRPNVVQPIRRYAAPTTSDPTEAAISR